MEAANSPIYLKFGNAENHRYFTDIHRERFTDITRSKMLE